MTDLPTGVYTCTDTVTRKGAATPGTSTSTIAWDQLSLLPVTITSTADVVAATANGTSLGTTQVVSGGEASPVAATATTTPAAGATVATTGVSGVAQRSTSTGLLLASVVVQALTSLL